MKIYVLVGLPGSGKSSWCKGMAGGDRSLAVINHDSIREMLRVEYKNYEFDTEWENIVRTVSENLLARLIRMEKDVIIDESHITAEKRRKAVARVRWLSPSATVCFVYFDTDVNDCIDRRKKDTKGDTPEKWVEVILDMYEDFEPIDHAEDHDEMIVECA